MSEIEINFGIKTGFTTEITTNFSMITESQSELDILFGCQTVLTEDITIDFGVKTELQTYNELTIDFKMSTDLRDPANTIINKIA